jgi:diguanylate cyclase (GGDEF)-like protein
LVPLLVLALGIGAGVAITGLYHDADQQRRGQLAVDGLRLSLAGLMDGAFRGDPRTGGSPSAASAEIALSKADARRQLRDLAADDAAPAELRGVAPAVTKLYPDIDELYRIGASGAGYQSPRAYAILRALSVKRVAILGALDIAGAKYGADARRSQERATIGTGATLLLLLGMFLLFYARSARARRRAEKLARENQRLWQASHDDAITDELTGLGNRRALNRDFEARIRVAEPDTELLLAMFDLDGFKQYNDTFGHGAGDVLLARMGERLAAAVGAAGGTYRMGGDEFCVLAEAGTYDGCRLVDAAVQALSDAGDGWQIDCSRGVAWIPTDADDMVEALRIADQRMYANKGSRSSAGRQTTAALVQVLVEQGDGLGGHGDAVADLSIRTAQELGMDAQEVQRIGLAAQLHDIGKAAIPEAILNKPGPLDTREWEFMRRHTLIGERIVLAASSLDAVAGMVRSSHERIDGTGYPDRLAGDAIPIGSRIIAVADAYHAMVSERPYGDVATESEAIEELERCAGTQFDPGVVSAFESVLTWETMASVSRSPRTTS